MEESQMGGFIVSLVGGSLLFLSGYLLKKHPPKTINPLYGYRSKRSMKNQAQWDAANRYSGQLMTKYAVYYAVSGSIVSFTFQGIEFFFVVVGLMLTAIALMIVQVEKRLKEMENQR